MHTQVKNYTLNVGKSLEKKLSGCASDHLTYEMKPGKNLVVSLSSAAYELTKRYIVEKAQSIEFSNMFAFVKERSVDQNNAVVEFRLKFFNRKKDGEIGCIQKFVVNFYNTTSRLMINGSRVDIFCEQILKPLEQYILSQCESLDVMNHGISSVIQAFKLKQGQKRAIQESVPQIGSNAESNNGVLEQKADQSRDSKQPELNSSVERLYFCPVCDQAAELETIACEQCDEWYHYSCAGITGKDIDKIGDDIPYICDCCADNALYGTITVNTGDSDRNGCGEKEDNNFNISRVSSATDDVLNNSHIPHDFKDSFIMTQDAFNENNDTNVTFNHTVSSPTACSDATQNGKQIVTETVNWNNDSDKSESGMLVIHQKVFEHGDRPNEVNVEPNSSHQSQQSVNKNEKSQSSIGAGGVDKRKSKTKDNKKHSDKQDLDQKIYILDLERKVKEQDKTINLLSKRMDLIGVNSNVQDVSENKTITTEQAGCRNTQTQQATQVEQVSMEMRMRQLEFNMLQSMAMFTTCTAHLNMQLQNQNTMLNNVQNAYSIQRNTIPFQHPMYNVQLPGVPLIGPHPSMVPPMGNQLNIPGTYSSVLGPQANYSEIPVPYAGPQYGPFQPPMMQQAVINPPTCLNGPVQHHTVPHNGFPQVPYPSGLPPVTNQQMVYGRHNVHHTGIPTEAQPNLQQTQVPHPPFSVPPPTVHRPSHASEFGRSAQHQQSNATRHRNPTVNKPRKNHQFRQYPSPVGLSEETTGKGETVRCDKQSTQESVLIANRAAAQKQETNCVEVSSRLEELSGAGGDSSQLSSETTYSEVVKNQADEQNVSVILIEDLTPLQQPIEDGDDHRNSPEKRKIDIDPICSSDLDCQDSSKHSFLAIPCLNLRPPDSPITELAVITRL